MHLPRILLALLAAPVLLFAQATPTAKQAPPPGIAVPEADAAELKAGLEKLDREILGLQTSNESNPTTKARLPDVEVFQKSVRYALQYGEFFHPKEIAAAKAQLQLGVDRVKELQAAHSSWTTATGPLVLGYRSRIDDSVQPYGLIVPEDWKPGETAPRPLYLWFHGRNDTLSEVAFIAGRMKAKRDFAPANAFELHLYGRYCNASKFAGETDAFEAMADVQARYSIDADRIVPMGFSMGGATVWHLGAHHAGLWAVASGGAGFAETAVYAKVFDPKKDAPPWWEQVLWRLYDATGYAGNFANVPLVTYSGELDPQIQSAQMMKEALAAEGLEMEWLIGPQTGHKYEPETKKEISRRVDAYMQKGRQPLAPHVRFTTYTLRYHQMKWVTVDALEKHWERADIDAQLVDEGTIRVKTKNVSAFTLAFPAGPVPLDKTQAPRVIVDDRELKGPAVKAGWTAHFRKHAGSWVAVEQAIDADPSLLAKRHGLQGPIDDAFMDSFIFVRPTGQALNEKVGAWAVSELDRAIVEWRKVFRGDARVKDDTAITPDDIANANLVLWGDPGSNAVLAKMLPRLPLVWTKDTLELGKKPQMNADSRGSESDIRVSSAAIRGPKVSAADHAPILIFPNPLNPRRYVVLNSGFTFRMGSKTSNSLQTPKLPDWAVIDLKTPPDDHWPGQVVDAGFFDERWK